MMFGVPPTINCNMKYYRLWYLNKAWFRCYKHAQLAKKVCIYANLVATKSVRDVGHMIWYANITSEHKTTLSVWDHCSISSKPCVSHGSRHTSSPLKRPIETRVINSRYTNLQAKHGHITTTVKNYLFKAMLSELLKLRGGVCSV